MTKIRIPVWGGPRDGEDVPCSESCVPEYISGNYELRATQGGPVYIWTPMMKAKNPLFVDMEDGESALF